MRHLQTHSGKTFKCPKKGCDYSTKAERNLKSHLILHMDTNKTIVVKIAAGPSSTILK